MKKSKNVSIKNRRSFGPHYGGSLIKNFSKIHSQSKEPLDCFNCNYLKKFKRIGTGIWSCKKCKIKAASNAFIF